MVSNAAVKSQDGGEGENFTYEALDIPNNAVVSATVLKLQDPRPGYVLYIPERMVPVACHADPNEHKIIFSTLALEDIFPGWVGVAKTFGVYSVTWTPAP
jgi:hypothetical protein